MVMLILNNVYVGLLPDLWIGALDGVLQSLDETHELNHTGSSKA